jgi:hypothetical protein
MMVLFKDVNLLEHDPNSQYKFNRFWALTWFITIVAIPFIPKLYAHSVSALIITEISLWANFASHFGNMSSALAAMNTSKTVADVADDVDDIKDDVSSVADVLAA